MGILKATVAAQTTDTPRWKNRLMERLLQRPSPTHLNPLGPEEGLLGQAQEAKALRTRRPDCPPGVLMRTAQLRTQRGHPPSARHRKRGLRPDCRQEEPPSPHTHLAGPRSTPLGHGLSPTGRPAPPRPAPRRPIPSLLGWRTGQPLREGRC